MILYIVIVVTALKLFFIPVYHSTDFEVHRNWLAITHNLTLDKWYYDTTSEWTLDYPPFFAWFEYGLSYIAEYFDPKMLELNNLNYKSEMTVLFQRVSVIFMDFLYIYGVDSCTSLVSRGELLAFILLVTNPGLLMVDHIHFQYNGFMYGILLYSISHIIKITKMKNKKTVVIAFTTIFAGECNICYTVRSIFIICVMGIFVDCGLGAIYSNDIQAAFWFAVLLNIKHLFLYIAPVYVVYLFRAYCFTVSSVDGVHTPWYSFSIINLFKLGTVVIAVLIASFGPFIDHIPQILSRLFPFKRGLCHAYWAPNFWALYNFGDKALLYLSPLLGYNITKTEAVMTGGLVQEYNHVVLPSITPMITMALTGLSMVPALYKLWCLCADRRYRTMSFVRCIIVCATCSFMFSWHVHEKAILMIIIPLSFMSVLGVTDAKYFLLLSTVGHYSLFPLLYPKNLLGIKLLILLTHVAIAFGNVPSLYEVVRNPKTVKTRPMMRLPMLNYLESLYLYGLLLLCFYENAFHIAWGLDKQLPFLPLMITSVYCALGVFYFWLCYYKYFITFNLSWVPTLVTPSLLQHLKKTS